MFIANFKNKSKKLLPNDYCLTSNPGYTLIEILVALTVIGLIFGIGYVNFRDFSRRQALASTVRKIKGDLRLAQEEAMAGKKPTDPQKKCVDPSGLTHPVLNGYNFNVTGAHDYLIQAVCSGGVLQIKSVTISSDISLATPSPNPIMFKILGQGTNIGVAPASLTLTQTGTAASATITITSSGEIK